MLFLKLVVSYLHTLLQATFAPGFAFSLKIGVYLGNAVYIYLIKFDHYSENQLITLSYYWVLPLAAAIFGLISETVLQSNQDMFSFDSDGYPLRFLMTIQLLNIVLLLLFWPLHPKLIQKAGRSIVMAMAGMLYFYILMTLFFVNIFPLL